MVGSPLSSLPPSFWMKCILDGRNWGCHLGSQVGRPMMRTIEQCDGKSLGPDAQETIILSLERLPGLHI